MGISTRQYQDIMNEYDAVRRRNYMAEQERKERVYALIPEIRQIDEQIAHISVEKAKALLLKQVSNAEAKKSLQDMPEIAHLARQHNNANVLVMPGRFIDNAMAKSIMDEFFATEFEGGRHQKRIDKIPVD